MLFSGLAFGFASGVTGIQFIQLIIFFVFLPLLNTEGIDYVKERFKNNYIEIYVKADLDTVTKRDVKGLYKKARAGDLKNFTGIDSAYEIPENAEIVLENRSAEIDNLVGKIVTYLKTNGRI